MLDIAATVRTIDAMLPDLARNVIRRYLDAADPATDAFLAAPDDRDHHQTEWHQWGIITHTRRFLHHHDSDVPCLLRVWGLESRVRAVLAGEVDGAPKADLLRIAILLHDIGKFGARKRRKDRFHFAHHEQLSGTIIRHDLHLGRYGLTPSQIEYIATAAEDHFVLGLMRKKAREQTGYDSAFVGGDQFVDVAAAIMRAHPMDFTEIGVLFLGDSLAKAKPGEGPTPALSQYELNIEAAHRYLSSALRSSSL